MFGFFIGTLSLIGLIKLYRHRRFGGMRRWALRRLFQELDTTPGQEKVILETVSQLEQRAYAVRQSFWASRQDLAQAMRAERFDGATIDTAFAKQQAAVDELKQTVRENLSKIHEALTPEQRVRAAQLIEFGPTRMHMHGCGHGRRMHGPFGASPSTVNL